MQNFKEEGKKWYQQKTQQFSSADPKEMEIYNLPDKEIKIIVLVELNELKNINTKTNK